MKNMHKILYNLIYNKQLQKYAVTVLKC